MIKSLFNFIFKLKYKELILLLGWFLSWLSIGVAPDEIIYSYYNLHENLLTVKNLHALRGFLPVIFFFLILLYFFSTFSINKNNLDNLIIIFLLLYSVMQIIGALNNKTNLINIYYTIQYINVLLILYLCRYNLKKKKILIWISIFFVSITFAITFSNFFYQYFITHNSAYSLWGEIKNNNYSIPNILFGDTPRVTGIARNAFVIFLFIFFFFYNHHNQKNKLLLVFFSFSILLLESRTMILAYLIFITALFVVKKKYFSDKNYLKFLFTFFILPLTLLILVMTTKKIFYLLQDNSHELILYRNIINAQNLTSNRYDDWIKAISDYKIYLKFGFGAQADRYLYNQTVSNGFLYALTSSGILGCIFYILASIISFLKIAIDIYQNKLHNYNKEKFFSYTIIIFIFFRSIVESSYAVFGIDFMIFSQSILFLKIKKKL